MNKAQAHGLQQRPPRTVITQIKNQIKKFSDHIVNSENHFDQYIVLTQPVNIYLGNSRFIKVLKRIIPVLSTFVLHIDEYTQICMIYGSISFS